MPLLNHTNPNGQPLSEPQAVGTMNTGIGNTTHGNGVYLTGAEQAIPVEAETYLYKTVLATTLVKDSAGKLHTVTFTAQDAVATAGSVALYDQDNTTADASRLITFQSFAAVALAPVTLTFDVGFSTGLAIVFTTTADVYVTVTYK